MAENWLVCFWLPKRGLEFRQKNHPKYSDLLKEYVVANSERIVEHLSSTKTILANNTIQPQSELFSNIWLLKRDIIKDILVEY